MKKDYSIGLDIGVGSVGFGVIDDQQNIIEAGTRLFPEADVSNNDGRRSKRSARRLKRRRKHRKERLMELLSFYDISPHRTSNVSPYILRVKGLTEQLSENELVTALFHLIKRRGVHNVTGSNLDEEEANDESLSTKEQIQINERQLKDKYVCELQLERLENEGEVRGHKNRFKTEDYVKEARALLNKQKTFDTRIDDSFIDQYIDLVEQRREYYEGPGAGSEYGWDQDIEKWYRQMMGKCSYFPEETRAVRQSYSAQLYNLLNDLNNLTILREENTKLSKNEKEKIIDQVFMSKGNPTLKKIAKVIDVAEEDIRGYRIKKNEQPEFTTLEFIQTLRKIDPALIELSASKLDQIAEILTIWQDETDTRDKLDDLDLDVKDSTIDEIARLNFSGTHSLSLKAIDLLLPDLWDTDKNQMQLFSEKGLYPKKVELKGRTKIPYEYVDDLILSPVVKRSFIQSIRIVNALIEKYGEPKTIVIELAREKNSKERQQFLKKMQTENEALNQQVREKLDDRDLVEKSGMFNKLRLWHLQDGDCLYSLKSIEIEDLIENPANYEIDHIIPRSVSFDDSQANKVLVHTEENQKKGNKTPYQYLKSSQGGISYEKFKSHILQLSKSKDKMPKKKRNYLLEERDINKFDVQKEFINRNLVDTRYATRELMTLLKAYFNENDKDVIVKPINGSFTNYLRKLWGLHKDRDEDYKHHAQDALIVAMAGYLLETKDLFKQQNVMIDDERIIDKETGELLDESTFDAAFTEKYHKVKEIKNYQRYKYSHRVDQKPNRQLMNDTIYSTRDTENGEFIIGKIKGLYNKDDEQLAKQFKKSPESFLMYEHDQPTFEKLETIMKRYAEAKNPLAKYHEETGEFLTKYSKNGKGPVVKSLKYKSFKLGSHKDLSYKFEPKNKRVVTLSLKPYRMDVYKDEERYKFITIRYDDLKEEKGQYIIPEEKYYEKLEEKRITNINHFQFSAYKSDMIVVDDLEYRFIGVNNDLTNIIELDTLNKKSDKRIKKTIGKKIGKFDKINTNVLGDRFPENGEKLRFSYNK
ncbi:type II CRISPR RNA-guided endonuclease Cas9 [Salicibibacter cibi]|uniref:CRISPR-associated endonuclease Cas9 n=1 Tax=Salicibibacter cibi TaxID=2743001 RepID=A0A7T6Z8R1_9BACI|nr:type II CRISPR RNA-guided endonuclease Cas9 [Salicibibacter cibi]QQK78953.1 type II CRISPR RNA-guided endonuclease Cas9 [Salicibibacter cibi]